MTQPIRVVVEEGEEGLNLLRDLRWDELLERQSVPNPTLCGVWLEQLSRTEQGTPLIAVAAINGRWVAGGAFALRRLIGRLGPRIVTWLGDERLQNQPDVLVDPNVQNAARVMLASVIKRGQVIHLGKAPLQGAAVSAVRELLPWARLGPSTESWVVAWPPPGREKVRKDIEYRKRRAASHGAKVSVKIVKESLDVADALERLFVLYRRRWLGRERDGIDRFDANEGQRAWYREAVGQMSKRGRVLIVEVYEDSKLVGSQLGFIFGRGALLHTIATCVGGKFKATGQLGVLTCIESAHAAGAEITDLGRGSCQPGSPKGRLDPTKVTFVRLTAAYSRAVQPLHMYGLLFYAWLRGVYRRLWCDGKVSKRL